MDKFIEKHLLDANCDAIESLGYTRRFTPEELNDRKDELAETSISISEIEEEKRSVDVSFKARRKPLDERKTELLSALKNKSEFVTEDCYKFIDYDERWVGFYNSEGELIFDRPIKPQEMQKTIFSEMRTGTNN